LLAVSSLADNCPPPMTCNADQISCPMGAAGPDGCPAQVTCMQAKSKSPIIGAGMCANFCAMPCGSNQMYCMGGTDTNGCQMSGSCMQMTGTGTGNMTCYNTCPIMSCPTNQMLCPGLPDSNGCKGMDSCVTRMVGNDNTFCPGTCPCQSGQMSCPSTDANGCTTTTCIPMSTQMGNATCPNFCPCPSGQMSCPSTDANGCTMNSCISMSTPMGNTTCPNFCPCPSGQMSCPSTTASGCPMTTCIPMWITNTPGKPSCPNFCPMPCTNGMVQCPPTPDSNGCMMPPICMTDSTMCPKPTK